MLTGSKLEQKWNRKQELSRDEIEYLSAWASNMLKKALSEDAGQEKLNRFEDLYNDTQRYLNREKVVVVKSTIPTIKRYGFDLEVERAGMADFGYKMVEKLNGFYAIVNEEGEIVDWAKPVLVHFRGEKYGNVRYGEMNTSYNVEIDGEPDQIVEMDNEENPWFDIDTSKCL